ncbi:hypothetical protein ACFQV2_35950 [Actinokineospora soli]|uniref:Secreted protein n=1 Tax=Actinokineospora soli TaxID=1048753 RepID=A0ABW2TW04_9PSEU
MRWLLIALTLIAGCGARPPAAAQPRPVVLIGDPAVWVTGFDTDETKLAAGARAFTLDAAPPSPPDGLITARAAFDALTRGATGPGSLRITRVDLGAVTFPVTDRGPMSLPAWLFHTAEGTVAWPADRPDRFWRLGEVERADLTARADGTRLRVQVPAPPGPCPGHPPVRQDLVVTETDDRVVITVRETGSPGDCALRADLRFAAHEVVLRAPLGDRVLLDDRGRAAVVGAA